MRCSSTIGSSVRLAGGALIGFFGSAFCGGAASAARMRAREWEFRSGEWGEGTAESKGGSGNWHVESLFHEQRACSSGDRGCCPYPLFHPTLRIASDSSARSWSAPRERSELEKQARDLATTAHDLTEEVNNIDSRGCHRPHRTNAGPAPGSDRRRSEYGTNNMARAEDELGRSADILRRRLVTSTSVGRSTPRKRCSRHRPLVTCGAVQVSPSPRDARPLVGAARRAASESGGARTGSPYCCNASARQP